jgi:5'-methylthioadenosine phosphorylase
MAHVTDYDVWHGREAPVTVDMVVKILNQNVALAQSAIRNLVKGLPEERSCQCKNAMATSIITNPKLIPAKTRKKLDLLIGKYIQGIK